jgi:hypothetical protein
MVAQALRRRVLTTEVWIPVQGSPFGIFGGFSCVYFFLSLSVSVLPKLHNHLSRLELCDRTDQPACYQNLKTSTPELGRTQSEECGVVIIVLTTHSEERGFL